MIAFWPCSTWDPDFVACLREHYTRSRGAPPGKKRAWRVIDHGVHRGYEWATLTGRYDDVMDYKRLCASCHKRFDNVVRNLGAHAKRKDDSPRC